MRYAVVIPVYNERRLFPQMFERLVSTPVVRAPEPAGLHPSLHAVLTRSGGTLELAHLVRAALEDPGGGARRVLERLGISPQSVLDRL